MRSLRWWLMNMGLKKADGGWKVTLERPVISLEDQSVH